MRSASIWQSSPPVHRSHDVIGDGHSGGSRADGPAPGTPVVAGGGDFPVSMLGFGIVGEGVTADVTGTSTLLATHAARPLIDPTIQNLRHVVDGWIPFTILDCGGLSMSWCRDLISAMAGRDVDYDETDRDWPRALPAGSDGLLFFPYMSGERRRENTLAARRLLRPHAESPGTALHPRGDGRRGLGMGKDVRTFRERGLEVIADLLGGRRDAQRTCGIRSKRMSCSARWSFRRTGSGTKGAALLAAAGVGLIGDPARRGAAASGPRAHD